MRKAMFAFVYLYFINISSAYAYIDPGSSTLIWQVVMAAFFGVMFYIKRIASWFTGIFKKTGR